MKNSPYLRIVTLKQQVMYVKLQNNIINLDLIKKVTEVKAYHVLILDYEEGRKDYHFEIETDEKEAQILNQTINGNEYQTEYMVAYGFEISYLNEPNPEKVITGVNRHEAKKFLEVFIQYLNNNQLTIPEIKI